jgi:hypothetical protein
VTEYGGILDVDSSEKDGLSIFAEFYYLIANKLEVGSAQVHRPHLAGSKVNLIIISESRSPESEVHRDDITVAGQIFEQKGVSSCRRAKSRRED